MRGPGLPGPLNYPTPTTHQTRNLTGLACCGATFCIPGVKMSHYYEEQDLERFDEIGKYRPDLYDIFMNYYQGVMSAGALTTREKALIALAVAHAVQCPYCIDAYTRGSLEAGSNMEEMTEAIHVAAAIRGGATLIHGIQAHNAAAKITL
jgi:alkylhydroperoxidase/carboxymuconolactone decarboxylase family protein